METALAETFESGCIKLTFFQISIFLKLCFMFLGCQTEKNHDRLSTEIFLAERVLLSQPVMGVFPKCPEVVDIQTHKVKWRLPHPSKALKNFCLSTVYLNKFHQRKNF